MVKKKKITDRFKVTNCYRMFEDDEIYCVQVLDGLKDVKLYTSRHHEIGSVLDETDFISSLSDFSIGGANYIEKYLGKFGHFVKDDEVHIDEMTQTEFTLQWKFEFHSQVDEISKAYFRAMTFLLRRSINVSFDAEKPKVTLRTEDNNHHYIYKLGMAIERLKWTTPLLAQSKSKESLEMVAFRKIQGDKAKKRASTKGTATLNEETLEDRSVIKNWLLENGYYPELSRVDANFLNRENLASKIRKTKIVSIKNDQIKRHLREIYRQ